MMSHKRLAIGIMPFALFSAVKVLQIMRKVKNCSIMISEESIPLSSFQAKEEKNHG